jgi:glycosyltransferase involved in cell wall biosynthesis
VKEPSISVITATLNSERDLPRLLASLRRQSDRDFDLVIVDGGSRDDTWSIVESSSDLVSTTIREPDNGLYDALNKGIRAATTEFYLVAGADDQLHTDAILNFRRCLAESGADIVVAAVMAGKSLRSGFHPSKSWLGHAAMVTSHSIGMIFRKNLHDRFGYYSLKYPVLADGLFIKRACLADEVKVVAASFVAGDFGMEGASNHNLARVLCESWQIQIETGEDALIQFLLFQFRLFRYLPRIIGKSLPYRAPERSAS